MGCHLAITVRVTLGCWHPLHILDLLSKVIHKHISPSCNLVLMHIIKMKVLSQVGKICTGTWMVTIIYDRGMVILMASNLSMSNLSFLRIISIFTCTLVGKLVFAVIIFLFSVSFPLFIFISFAYPIRFLAPFSIVIASERGKPNHISGSFQASVARLHSPLPSSILYDSTSLSSSLAMS